MGRPARRRFTAPAPYESTTSFLLRKNLGARLEPDETVPAVRGVVLCRLVPWLFYAHQWGEEIGAQTYR
jgi:hypothetical protein